MNLWFGKAIFIIGFFGIGYIRDPHLKRNKKIKVVDNRKSKFDISLLILVTIAGVVIPALWMILDIFSFADYPLYPAMFGVGLLLYIVGFWLFKKSHDDLGTNWSVSLELREHHRLVENGIYNRIRHPMYSSLFLYSAAQIFLLPNWVVGPLGVLTFLVLYLCRVNAEEKMMLDKFGDEYRTYMGRTKRLIPGLY